LEISGLRFLNWLFLEVFLIKPSSSSEYLLIWHWYFYNALRDLYNFDELKFYFSKFLIFVYSHLPANLFDF